MLRLEDFRHIVPDETLAEIYAKARRLYGKHIVHLNATYQGGGVAEAEALRTDLQQFLEMFREHEQSEERLLRQAVSDPVPGD